MTRVKLQRKINNNTAIRSDIITYLKSYGLKGLNKYKRIELLAIFKLTKRKVKDLRKILADNNVKGRSKMLKIELVNRVSAIAINKMKEINELKKKLRDNREVKNNRINQGAPIDIINLLPIKIVDKINTFDKIYTNKWIRLFMTNIKELVEDAKVEVDKVIKGLEGYIGTMIQVLYVTEHNGASPRYTELINIDDFEKNKISVTLEETDVRFAYIGYKIHIIHGGNLKNKDIKLLKAYHPCNNIKFHEETVASTSGSGLCIYETWRHIMGIESLRYARRDNKEYRERLYKDLKNEGKDIENAVKNGELVNSLLMLTKKYNNYTMISFFGSHVIESGDDVKIDGNIPIIIDKGEVVESNYESIKKFNRKICFLYDKDIHVAPFKFCIIKNKIVKKELEKIKEVKKGGFVMKPTRLKKNNEIKTILGFDIETYGSDVVPFNVTLYGDDNGHEEIVKESFYGLDCVDRFVNYIDSISTKMNNKITRSKKSVPNILIYGFNNSNFDNLLIYQKFFDKDPNTEYVFANNSVKYIKYNNVLIHDISLFYNAGTLRDTCEKFKLKEEKGIYPYTFPNSENLYYEGSVPEGKYWNSNDDYNEYIEKNGNEFNMKEYTEKYCMLDSKLVYQMGKMHIKNSKGEINGRRYDVTKAPTSAGLSVKMFSQCFLNDTLRQSADEVVKKERDAYFGGRTEVFKKYFKSKGDERLYYYDINSSYPASMTKMMPFKFIKSYDLKEMKVEAKQITDYHLYKARVVYTGENDNYIPNIFRRLKDNSIITTKETEYNYHWGCEIREAILSDCDVYIKEVNLYEGKDIFKDFANYFYDERLKVKKSNASLSMFYKLVMNSLYGKMGQKPHNHSKLCKYEEISDLIKGDINKLLNIKEIDDIKCLIEYKSDGDKYLNIGQLVRFSSYISALSRTNLISVMRDVGHKNVYYCDTDSIFTCKKISDKFIDQNILGMWKQECCGIIEAAFLAPKVYYYITEDGKRDKKAKGLHSESISLDDMRKLNNEEIKLLPVKRPMFHRSLNGININIDASRTLRPVYNKRKWNGNESTAFENYDEYYNYNKK